MNLKDKKVTVVGLGNSGFNAAILLDDLGASVRVTDSNDAPDIRRNVESLTNRGMRIELGRHTKDFVMDSELVVVSPGIENSSPAIKWAEEFNIPIISELELGWRFSKGRIIAITGTNGKSTVTALIGEILKEGGKDAVVCGNIGNALSGEIGRIKEDTAVVLEVSSFQLERIKEFRPHIAVMLNITDDHLDRYRNFEEYFKEKAKIFCNQNGKDILILNYDAANLRNLKSKVRSRVLFYSRFGRVEGAYTKNGNIAVSLNDEERELFPISETRLKGLHNLENVLAASLAGLLLGVDENSIREAVRNFKGLPHRFETVDIIGGVEYIDDSKGTTVDSTARALESCERPVILIAGGKDKNSDYSSIKGLVKRKAKRIILIGEAKDKIRSALSGAVEIDDADDMDNAARIARRLAATGDIVLLSPMCSSFDMFRDYKERGDAFKEAVRGLKKGAKGIRCEAREARYF